MIHGDKCQCEREWVCDGVCERVRVCVCMCDRFMRIGEILRSLSKHRAFCFFFFFFLRFCEIINCRENIPFDVVFVIIIITSSIVLWHKYTRKIEPTIVHWIIFFSGSGLIWPVYFGTRLEKFKHKNLEGQPRILLSLSLSVCVCVSRRRFIPQDTFFVFPNMNKPFKKDYAKKNP